MAVRFSPDGFLDVATEASDLPSQAEGKNEYSGAMTRCTNLRLDRSGMAETRAGYSRLSTVAVPTATRIMEHAGDRYLFTASGIYRNETSIVGSLSGGNWVGVPYNAFNVTTQSLFATNGTDRKRIVGANVYEWGIDAPSAAPTIAGSVQAVGIFDWEETQGYVVTQQSTGTENWAYLHGWEDDHMPPGSSGTGFWAWAIHDDRNWDAPSRSVTIYIWGIPVVLTIVPGILGMWPDSVEDVTSWRPVATSTAWTSIYRWTIEATSYECAYEWEYNYVEGLGDLGPDTITTRTMFAFEFTGDSTTVYHVRITYRRKSGTVLECESNPSDAVQIAASNGLFVSWTTPTDPQVTHVGVYRSLANGDAAECYFFDEVPIAKLSTTIIAEDTDLGTLVSTEHDRPPVGIVALSGPDFNGVLFGLVGNKVYFASAKQPEYWPALNYVEIGPPQYPGTALALWGGQVWAFTKHRTVQIAGTGSGSFFPIPMPAVAGAVNARSVLAVMGHGIYHLGTDGLYLHTGTEDDRVSDKQFHPVFDGDDAGPIKGYDGSNVSAPMFGWYQGKAYLAYASADATYADQILQQDPGTSKTSHYDYGVEWKDWTIDRSTGAFWALASDGYVYRIESGTTDNGTAIAWQIESKTYSDQLRRYYPRYARWDVGLDTGATATGQIVLEEAVVQSHVLADREPRKRHVSPCNGKRVALRIVGTGHAKVYGAEVD